MKFSRRDFATLAVGGPLSASLAPILSAKAINSRIDGVMIGAQTYSFRDRDLEGCLQALKDVGLGYAELWQGHLEPKEEEEAKKWRANPPLDGVKEVRRKFDEAGVVIYAFNYSFRDGFSDAEIENGFKIAKAMGVNKITASANVDLSPRIDPFAQEYKIFVGFHNHDSMKPNEFSTAEDFAKAMEGRSKFLKINLDIGHFTAANFDPVPFIEQHHADILTLHFKDRKMNHGANMPFGQGDTKLKEALQLLKTKRYPIPAMIEYEYGKSGMDSVAEVKKCYEFMKQALG